MKKKLLIAIPILVILIVVGVILFKKDDNYSISGYLYDSEGNIIANGNLVIYSNTPHYTKTDNRGYYYMDNLEKGEHEVYYLGIEDIKELSKEEVIELSKVKIELSTENNNVKYSNEEYSTKLETINNIVNNTYNITLDTDGGKIDTKKYEVTKNHIYGSLPTPSKENYIFDGWYYNDEEILSTTYVTLDETHTLKAKYHLGAQVSSYTGEYDGKEHTIDIETNQENAKITYSKDGKTYSEDKIYYKNVGNYTIYYKVKYEDNNEEKGSASVTITKRENPLSLKSNKGTVSYPNTTTLKLYNYESDDKINIESSNTKVAVASITNNIITIKTKSIGTTTLTITLNESDNYKEKTITYNLTVDKGTFDVSSTGYDSIYDGNEHSIIVNPSIEDTTITYSLDNKTFTTDKPKYKNAGEYTVYYKVEKDNYDTVNGYEIIKISKSNNTLLIDKTSGDITYPESDTITVTTNANITAKSSNENIAIVSVNGNKVIVNAGTTSGTATITISTIEDDNHKSSTATYIANVISNPVTTSEINYTGAYDGNTHTGSITSTLSNVTFKYGLTEEIYDLNTIPEFTDAGSYTIYYQASKDGYSTKSGNIKVTINKIENTLSLNETSGSVVYPNTKTFNVAKNTSNGLLSIESSDTSIATVSISNNVVTVTPIKDGNVTIKVTSSETTNYKSKSVNYTLTINKGTFTVTDNGYESTYDGSAHSITVTPNISDTTITYSTDNVTFTSVNPTYVNSGTYTVYYKVEKVGYETATGSEIVKINKADNTVSIDKSSGNLTYPNTDTVTVTTNASLKIESSNENIATSSLNGNTLTIMSGTSEGTATITISTINDSNHNGQSVTYTANVSHGTLNISASNYTGTYDENEYTGSVSSSLDGVTIKYGTVDGTYDLNELPKYTNTGNYTIYYEAKKDGYNTVNNSITVTINKAENTLILNETSSSVVYPNTKTFNVTKNTSSGTLSVVSSDTSIATVSITNNVVTVTPIKNGNVTLTVTSASTNNYNKKTATYNLTINKGTFTVTANGYESTYDGSAHSITVTPSIDGTTITYSTDNVTFTSTNPEYTNVGEYTVYYKVEKNGYETITGNKTINITPSTYTLSIDKTSGNITYPLSDTINVTTSTNITASSNNTNVATASVNGKVVTVTAGTTEGSATITISTVADSNHNSVSVTYTANISNGTFTVTKTNYNGTYDGNEHTGTTNSSISGVTFKYGETSGTYNLNDLPKYKTAGTYAIYYQATKTGYTTQTGSLTVTINKADNTLTLSETSGSITYPNTKIISVSTNTSNGTISASSNDTTIADVSVNGNDITIYSKAKEGNATITVTSEETINYKLAFATYTITVGLPSYNVTFNKTNTSTSSDTISIKYGSSNKVTITPNDDYYISSVSCTNGYTTNVTTGEDNDEAQEITISNNNNLNDSVCTITSTIKPYISLYNIIKKDAKNDTISFKVRSGVSGTNGVYKTTSTDSGNTVYYYRGNVNNNAIFNNMCWKIIRTTETGGVKLIYNGTPTDGECTATGTDAQIGTTAFNTLHEDNAYVGYMYGASGSSTYESTHANTNDSPIKTYIDNWYSTNFTNSSITSKIEDTVFCNDRSIVQYNSSKINDTRYVDYNTLGYGVNGTLYGAMYRSQYRTISPNPSLVCSQVNDKFTVSNTKGNGKLSYPVGLITLDEVAFAGFNTWASNSSDYFDTNNYLYTGQNYWTMTPTRYYAAWNDADVGYVGSEGQIEDYVVTNNFGVRPVISLIDGILVTSSGTGETTNPYIVETELVVTYNPNGGSVTYTNGYQKHENNYINLPTPTKTGYTFDGWFTQETGGSEVTSSTIVTNSSSHTLYAHWVLTDSLYSVVMSQAKNDTISFNVRSGTSKTNGVYKTNLTDSGNTVYYYRGNVNNNVIFNNMCWKIIRTTETGGVKLIYNGTPSSGQCTATGTNAQIGTSVFNTLHDDNAYVGYMYGKAGSSTYALTHANNYSSTIKNVIDNWYSTNFTSSNITSKIEDTVYCDDRSVVKYNDSPTTLQGTDWVKNYNGDGINQNATLYGVMFRGSYRTASPSPTLKCSQSNDKFTVNSSNGNGALTYPVALITLDEVIFAGFNTYQSNPSDYQDTNSYLYTGTNYWTISPAYYDQYYSYAVLNFVESGISDYNQIRYEFGVRPVISLKDGTLVDSGTGTTASPYVVN